MRLKIDRAPARIRLSGTLRFEHLDQVEAVRLRNVCKENRHFGVPLLAYSCSRGLEFKDERF